MMSLAADLKSRRGYIPSLDGMRAVSILIVMGAHFVTTLIPGGMGVYVFFVVSGFLISRLMFAEQQNHDRIDLRAFYVRRFLRLYPVIFVYTAVVIVTYLSVGLEIDWRQPASAIFYFANYFYAIMERSNADIIDMPFKIFWSLSIEEHFYLLFPALFLFLKGNPRSILWACGWIILGTLALRVGSYLIDPEVISTRDMYFMSHFRFDSIAFGVAISAMLGMRRGRVLVSRVASPWALAIGVSLLLASLVYRDPVFRETLRYSVIGMGITLCLISVLFSSSLHWLQVPLNSGVANYIGRLSYSLYVWHLLTFRYRCISRLIYRLFRNWSYYSRLLLQWRRHLTILLNCPFRAVKGRSSTPSSFPRIRHENF